MDSDLSWLSDMGVDVETGIMYTGNPEKYLSALQRFYKNYNKNSAKLRYFYETEDYENYAVVVHALKSNSKMIGAMELSDRFEKLELSALHNQIDTIKAENESALEAYSGLIKGLSPVGVMPGVKAEDEISADEARELADKCLEALDDFDCDLFSELLKRLHGYPFRLTQRELLKKAEDCIENFDYDDAAAVMEKIAEGIE